MGCPRGKANPDQHTKLRLFADSAGFCQSPFCNQKLFMDTHQHSIHIAEMAHVFAAKDAGPRADSELTEAERGSYVNLILLCPTCHTVIDKAPNDYPDSLILEWKRRHVEQIAAVFGAVEYETRKSARAAIEQALVENRQIFDDYGPENDYKSDPESELASSWQLKVRSRILPNNRKILAILDANRHLLQSNESITLEHFRQHVQDMEIRHLGEERTALGRRFPAGMTDILTENLDAR